ncbi:MULTISPECIES: helix-turn-helix domain-containing protein [Herbaspirillum]|uniref:Helix-turn-helix transcriptional regulator n=3 Tax=Herbaspirillum TaxID=963 RepID=A0AAJ2LXZ8_9BURK|nr:MULTISPECIES: helix-turn-helix transcriptional regulator [Herbaspirillum]MDR9839686.1 helix-turn-helix transcriptional regulator [Herbaspirillum huttiense]OWY32462.1 transcriptional regulator [Herbaspirillum aquaticum]
MNTTEQATQPRMLSTEELATFIKFFRELRHWSQEQLGEISGLSVRTIQRIETGEASSPESRRALARAFEFEDIDALNKSFLISSPEELAAEKEKFDRDHVTLTALPLTTGKQLAQLAETCAMDFIEAAYDASREVERVLADLTDYFREYRESYELYAQADKFDVYDEMQTKIDSLKSLGMSLRYARRRMAVTFGMEGAKPVPVEAAYIVGFPLGKEPESFATPKEAGIRGL